MTELLRKIQTELGGQNQHLSPLQRHSAILLLQCSSKCWGKSQSESNSVLFNVFSNSSLSDSKIFNSSPQWCGQEFTMGGKAPSRWRPLGVWGRIPQPLDAGVKLPAWSGSKGLRPQRWAIFAISQLK